MRQAMFRCVRSNKILFCRENDDLTLDYGVTFLPLTDVDAILRVLETSHIANYPPKEGYFEHFVIQNSRTTVRLL